jgi:lipopolysaccharide export system permease protein
LKTLHNYLTRQILASLVLTVSVFSFVLLLVNVLKELLPLLLNGHVTFWIVAEAVGLLIPFVWVFALPMGMLTATLLIFGRFSADQELTAVRASGISLISLVSPILLLSLAFCVLSALVNLELGPRARITYTSMLENVRVEFARIHLPEGRFIKFPGFIFCVGKNDKGLLRNVVAFELKGETNVEYTVQAQRGKLEVDETNKVLNLTLYDGNYISANEGGDNMGSFEELKKSIPLNFGQGSRTHTLRIEDMTFTQLLQELRNLERMGFPASRHSTPKEQLAAMKREWQRRHRDMVTPILFQLHREVAFSFACFGFTLVGIPLGIRVHRRETNVGIAVALALAMVYYMFIAIAQSVDTRPEFAPYLIVWLPNFVFQTIGAVLLWRANRGV